MRRALPAVCACLFCLPAVAVASPVPAVAAGAVAPAAGSVAPPPAAAPSAPPSGYQPRHVCPAPAPGHAGCLALELIPGTGAVGQAGERARSPFMRPLAARGAPARTQAAPGFAAGQTPEPMFPEQLRGPYQLPAEPVPGSAPQTIALVDAYNDPEAAADLRFYDKARGLPECSGCLTKVNQSGESAEGAGGSPPFPKSAAELEEQEAACKSTGQEAVCAEVEEAEGWDLEISTDVDVAHFLCPTCHILLVEADSSAYPDLEKAEDTAVRLGATEVSNSWSGPEPESDSPAFEHPGTVITAAAGDDGYLNWTDAGEPGYFAGVGYPASSPHVVAVGGTELTLTEAGARRSETVWNEDPDPSGGNEGGGGGGCSTEFPAPAWQREVPDWSSVGCGTGAESKRAVADIAADADPFSGVYVYDSLYESGKDKSDVLAIGGTSVASPIVASAFALAGGAHGVAYPAQTLYSRLGSPLGFPSTYDVTAGGNGRCDDLYTSCSGSMQPLSPRFPLDCGKAALICNAAPGYDGPTGVGAPDGIAAFEPESAEEHAQRVKAEEAAEATRKAEERKAEEELKATEAHRKLEEEAKAAEARKAEEERKAAEQKLEEEAARAQTVGGSGGNGGGEATVPGANQPIAGASGLGEVDLAEAASEGSSSQGSSSGKARIRLTGLALTARASAVIARGLPTVSQVAFAFTLSAPARVRATLSRQVLVHGRPRWVSAPGARTLAAGSGRRQAHLRGHGTLAPGRYRLTLTPARGGARSIVFVLR